MGGQRRNYGLLPIRPLPILGVQDRGALEARPHMRASRLLALGGARARSGQLAATGPRQDELFYALDSSLLSPSSAAPHAATLAAAASAKGAADGSASFSGAWRSELARASRSALAPPFAQRASSSTGGDAAGGHAMDAELPLPSPSRLTSATSSEATALLGGWLSRLAEARGLAALCGSEALQQLPANVGSAGDGAACVSEVGRLLLASRGLATRTTFLGGSWPSLRAAAAPDHFGALLAGPSRQFSSASGAAADSNIASHDARSTASAAGAGSVRVRPFLVKLSCGFDFLIRMPRDELLKMDRMTFVDHLANSGGFSTSFLEVPRDKCRVFLLRKVLGEEPTAAEETDTLELRDAKTFSELAALVDPMSSAYFARVRVEETRAVGSLPYDPRLGISPVVWAGLGPRAQETAKRVGELRRRVRSVAALGLLSRHLRGAAPHTPLALPSAADARTGGISVLSKGDDGSLEVGFFDVPPLDDAVAPPPKPFSFVHGFRVLVLPQRLELAFEFVLAVMNRMRDEGTLFSGPNGVGKSGIGLLAYLLSVYSGQLVAYISRSQDWVAAAKRGNGDAFLLETFWRQNADVIAASDELRPFFKDAMEDRAQPFTEEALEALRRAVASRTVPGVGIIADEVQAITQVVAATGASTEVQRAGRYFASRWHDWSNKQGVFARMSIASSHGVREMTLPDSEERRLRFVEPLSPALIAVMQTDKSSPAFIADEKLRAHVAFIVGGILRHLIGGADLARGKRDSKDQRAQIWHALWVPMAEKFSRWRATYPASSPAAISNALELVHGELPWGHAKPLYDDGLVARTASSAFVEPVSPVAAAVILQTVAGDIRGQRISLGTKKGAERGIELERQMWAAINPCNTLVPSKRLDGSYCSSLQLHASYAVVFKHAEDIVPHDDAVAYLPHNPTYACDAILLPAADDAGSPIVILESSVTDPLDSDRVKKVRKWFGPDGIVTMLRALFPSRQVVSALVWDQVLVDREVSNTAAALSIGKGPDLADAATAATNTKAAIGEHVVVIDKEGILRLHIVP